MPITYEIDFLTALIVTRCTGDVRLGDVQEHFRELAHVWPQVNRLDVLLDLRDQTSLPDVEKLVEAAKEMNAQIGAHRFGRCAVVANEEPMRDAMHTFGAVTRRFFDGGLQVFRTPEDARTWLASKPDPAGR